MADIFDRLERLREQTEEARDEAKKHQDAIDELQGELDACYQDAEWQVEQAWEILNELLEDDPAYDEVLTLCQDLEEIAEEIRE